MPFERHTFNTVDKAIVLTATTVNSFYFHSYKFETASIRFITTSSLIHDHQELIWLYFIKNINK